MAVRLGVTQGRHRLLARSDAGVSPVIGMILVLAISIVGIATILYWGLPAIDEMKANVEYRSVMTQFSELDATIKELVAGTTEKTAKRFQPALNRGSMSVYSDNEGWLMAMETYNATANIDLVWTSMADGDNSFSIHHRSKDSAGAPIPVKSWLVKAYIVTGTTSQTALNVTGGIAATGDQMPQMHNEWAYDTAKTFTLHTANVAGSPAQNIAGATFRFQVYSGPILIAEAWYVNTGTVEYRLEGISTKALVENNGGLMAGEPGQFVIVNTPSLPPPTQAGATWRFFGRVISMTGEASFAGDDRYDLLISLYSTATLASYDCARDDFKDCAESSKIFVYGDYQQPWYDYFLQNGHGYRFGTAARDVAGVKFLEQREDHMAYTLLGSTVNLVG